MIYFRMGSLPAITEESLLDAVMALLDQGLIEPEDPHHTEDVRFCVTRRGRRELRKFKSGENGMQSVRNK